MQSAAQQWKSEGISKKGLTSNLTSHTADVFHHCCWVYIKVKLGEKKLLCRLYNIVFLSFKTQGTKVADTLCTLRMCRVGGNKLCLFVYLYRFVSNMYVCVHMWVCGRMTQTAGESLQADIQLHTQAAGCQGWPAEKIAHNSSTWFSPVNPPLTHSHTGINVPSHISNCSYLFFTSL